MLMQQGTFSKTDLTDKLNDTAAVVAFVGEVAGYIGDLELSKRAVDGMGLVLRGVQESIEDVAREVAALEPARREP